MTLDFSIENLSAFEQLLKWRHRHDIIYHGAVSTVVKISPRVRLSCWVKYEVEGGKKDSMNDI